MSRGLLSAPSFSDDEVADLVENILEASTEYSMIATDLEGTVLLWNEGARRHYGYEPAEIIGKSKGLLHPPEDVEASKPREMMEAALERGKWEDVVDRVRKDGSRFPARLVLTPRRDAAGKPVGFLLISKDISDEQRVYEELRETESYTRSLIESNIDALMTTDPLGVISDINQQMEALTGWSRDELIGSPFKTYFTEPERAEDGIKLTLREGKVTNYELTARAKDGRETVVSYNASTFTDSDGKLQGVFAAARDVKRPSGSLRRLTGCFLAKLARNENAGQPGRRRRDHPHPSPYDGSHRGYELVEAHGGVSASTSTKWESGAHVVATAAVQVALTPSRLAT